jgi:hypothetical protein
MEQRIAELEAKLATKVSSSGAADVGDAGDRLETISTAKTDKKLQA